MSIELYFVAKRRGWSRKDARMDGYFVIPQFDFYCKACSGSSGLQPLPAGTYRCTHFRNRTEGAMVRDGVGFSVNLSDKWDPVLKRDRKLLRIHPDGGKPGSEGCVAILDHVKECRDYLKQLLPAAGSACKLDVQYCSERDGLALCTEWGCYLWA